MIRGFLLFSVAFALCAVFALPARALTKDELTNALSNAVQSNNLQMAEMLLKQGANADACHDAECDGTMFTEAMHGGHVEMMRLLVKFGANPNNAPKPKHANFDAKHWIPAFDAIDTGGDALTTFVALGGNLNGRDLDGNTWLISFYGPTWGKPDAKTLLAFLHAHGFDFRAKNDKGETALINWAKQCRADVVTEILAYGGDPKVRDASGHTAADYATLGGCMPVLAALK